MKLILDIFAKNRITIDKDAKKCYNKIFRKPV